MVDGNDKNQTSGEEYGCLYWTPIDVFLFVVAFYVFEINPSDKVNRYRTWP